MRADYRQFIESKQFADVESGFDPTPMNEQLFPFQAAIVEWACKRGRAAIFANTGLGKTAMQCEWAYQVHKKTGGDVLIVAPLCVAKQTVEEAAKFGITVEYCRSGDDSHAGLSVTNYEMLEHFNLSEFDGLVLDESSILKNRDGKTRKRIIEAAKQVPYRLSCTATPSPNDYMELGNQAEFLGVMSMSEMLAMFFVHDGGETNKWRLKGHGKNKFWEWLATWAVCIRKPSDLGFDDTGYDLPPFEVHQHMVESQVGEGQLFAEVATTLTDRRTAKRQTLQQRVDAIAEVVNASDEQWLVWCHLNDEQDALTKAIPNAVSVAGADSIETKESRIMQFIHFSDKLAGSNNEVCPQCQKKRISKNTTKQTEKNESNNQSNTNKKTEKPGANTCVSTQERTGKSSGAHLNSKRNTTSGGGKNTPHAKTREKNSSVKSQNGSETTPKSDSLSDSGLTGSHQKNTTQCLSPKGEDAQYAEAQTRKTNEQTACLLTTATNQEKSGDCSVRPVISESESLETIQTCSCQQPNTSGRVVVSKPSIMGFGLNLQHCHNMAFVGLDDSYEQQYQAIRRCWRFGQTKTVDVHFATAESLGAIKQNVERKEQQMEEMQESMVSHMRELTKQQIKGMTMEKSDYKRDVARGESWKLHLGDCVDVIGELEDESIGYTIFSPPFASLYTYTNSDYDMGNTKGDDEFYAQFAFLVEELYRVTKPGRLLSFHCMNLPTIKQNDGYIGVRDFRGEMLRLFISKGWIFHSEVCIWKDPVTSMQRTKALGLLHKTIRKDSAMSRQAIPDYLVTMRKPGDNAEPISHDGDSEFPVTLWQRYASPVWMDINPSRTLQYMQARDDQDERHICPLQLDVIERGLELWSRSGDLVLSPFAGIGSEGYCAVRMGRKFVGAELKESYWRLACENLKQAEMEPADMFGSMVARAS